MSGYYDNESETEKAMAPDGWFRTGDIGAWAPNGHLKLLDRKKNLVKTSLGEYIALEKVSGRPVIRIVQLLIGSTARIDLSFIGCRVEHLYLRNRRGKDYLGDRRPSKRYYPSTRQRLQQFSCC